MIFSLAASLLLCSNIGCASVQKTKGGSETPRYCEDMDVAMKMAKASIAEEIDTDYVRVETELVYCSAQIHEKSGYFVYSVKLYEKLNDKDYVQVDKIVTFVKQDGEWFLVDEKPIFIDLDPNQVPKIKEKPLEL